MREVNISGLDLNLLPALDALLRRRNITRAAADVGLSQPAMSRALSRLRALHGDRLLVRTRGGYALTPRATALQPHLAQALRSLRDVFQPQAFDPAEERRSLRLAASDAQAVLLLPMVMARLARDAPGVDVVVEPYGPDPTARLDAGTLDLAFALDTTPLPPGIHSEVVAEDRLVLVMRRGHPAEAKTWEIADYGTCLHVGVALLGDGRSDLDAVLAAAGVSRRVALVTPHFMAALATVASTDMITTLSRALALRFARAFDLVLRDPPFPQTRLGLTLAWSHVRAADPFLVWFRGVVREVARDDANPPGSVPRHRSPLLTP